jgi:1-acyl-sn-glycerol-3-phosphate acyltransferase
VKPAYKIIHGLARFLFQKLYRHEVYGIERLPIGGAIIAPNHNSWMDPPLVLASVKEELAFLAWSGLFKKASLKFLLKKTNAYPISDNLKNVKSFKLISQLIKENHKVVVFPEGGISEDGNLQSIKTGVTLLMTLAECSIVPVYIAGSFEAWPGRRKLPRIKGKTACVFGNPIPWERFSSLDKKEAQEALSKTIERSIEELRQWYKEGAQGTPP